MKQENIHESYSREETVALGSERSFGTVMAAAFALIALLNWWHSGHVWPWTGGLAAALLATSFLFPSALKPFNWIWFKFGMLLHAVVNPIVMGLLFFVAVWPTGLVMRALGKDLLRLRREPDTESYWIVRQPPGPA